MISLADNGDEQVALIGEAYFDYEDPDYAALVFSVYTSESVASTQRLAWQEAQALLATAQASDLAAESVVT